MEILLTIFYSLLLAALIYRLRFFKIPGISKPVLIALFFLKCVVAVCYIELHETLITGGDIFDYFNDAIIAFESGKNGIKNYLQLMLGPNNVKPPEHLFRTINQMGYWKDSSAYTIVRMHLLIYPISFGYLWVHSIFFSFLSFTGLVALAKLISVSCQKFSTLAVLSLFLFPTILFWTSGIHKEGVLTFALGLFLYGGYRISFKKFRIQTLLISLLGFAIIYLVRDFLLLLLIPGILSFIISKQLNRMPLLVYSICYLIFFSIFILFDIPGREMNILEIIHQKRLAFLSLQSGNSSIELGEFYPTIQSFLTELPDALINTLFRPFILEAKGLLQVLVAVENLFLILLFLLMVRFFHLKASDQPILLFLLFFSFSLLIIIGLIVPNLGAISRYRSIAFIFLIPSLFYIINND